MRISDWSSGRVLFRSDFVNYLGLTADLGVRPHFMGKLSLFRWPIGGFMRQMGGIPVDRTNASNAVQQMVDEFARRAEFMLAVAPEGTRGKAKKWRTGFYQKIGRAHV